MGHPKRPEATTKRGAGLEPALRILKATQRRERSLVAKNALSDDDENRSVKSGNAQWLDRAEGGAG